MIELPDDELDRLFRKSSEEFDPIYDPNDWNDLEKRLDAVDRPRGWWSKWLPLGLLLLGFVSGLVLLWPKGELNKDVNKNATALKREDGDLLSGSNKSAELRVKEEKQAAEVAGEAQNAPVRPEGEESVKLKDKAKSNPVKILPPSRSKAGGVYLEPNRSSGKVGEGAFLTSRKGGETLEKSAELRRGNKGDAATPEARGDGFLKTAKTYSRSEREESLQQVNSGRDEMTERRVSALQRGEEGAVQDYSGATVASRSLPWMIDQQMLFPRSAQQKGLVLPAIEEPVEERSIAATKPVDKTLTPLFAVRFGYAPDLSTVGLKDFSRPGGAVSMLGEWAVFRRTYVQTGVIWSSKIYSAPGKAYQIPKEPHDYGPAPVGVDGQCKVFELPLNIRYDIYQGKSARWFATAGGTSYHMNSEAYQYRFENENDPKIKYRAWKGATGWYLFSHLNASAGYEYMLTRRLSLMAEPYLKIPIKRVGYGKANLFTTGAWISVRYTPVFRRN